MAKAETKVVGYFAYWSRTEVVCAEVDACVISGSIEVMKDYMAEIDPSRASKATIKKTRFGEIRRGLELGAAYAFDEESYARFYLLAVDAGLPVAPADFEKQSDQDGRFFTVRLAVL